MLSHDTSNPYRSEHLSIYLAIPVDTDML